MANVNGSETAYDAVSVTPSDTGNLGGVRGLYVGTSGDVKVDTSGGTTTTFVSVISGTILPIRATRVYSTGTTASNIVAMK